MNKIASGSIIAFIIFLILPLATAAEPRIQGEDVLTLKGLCDASGLIVLDDSNYLVASDEGNSVFHYRPTLQDTPLNEFHFAEIFDHKFFGLEKKEDNEKKKKKKGGKSFEKKLAGLEIDLEGSTVINGIFYFITSHDRAGAKKRGTKRRYLMGISPKTNSETLSFEPVGTPFTALMEAMAEDSRFSALMLNGYLDGSDDPLINIEGLTDTESGSLLVGFRSPLIDEKALIVTINNPSAVLDGQSPRFEVRTINLKGSGIRAMARHGSKYFIVAGPVDDSDLPFELYQWAPEDSEKEPLMIHRFSDHLQPEAIALSKDKKLLILSDDGAMEIEGTRCKDLPETLQRFRMISYSIN